MSMFSSFGPNRYMCSVLDEMRKQLEVLDILNLKQYKSITAMCIEEIQTMGNRMESAIEDVGDIEKLLEKRNELKREIRKLRTEKSALEDSNKDEE